MKLNARGEYSTEHLVKYFQQYVIYTAAPPMNCKAPLSPPRNGTISDHSVPSFSGTQVKFQCDVGLFPEGIMTATCLATGEWDKNPVETVCRGKCIHYLK